jgi:hypothetical protein
MELKKWFLFLTLMIIFYTSPVIAQEKVDNSEKLGQVHFPISCNSGAQKQFERAVALLHSFWFEEAGKAFAAVTQEDPGCAMGYWGIAMSFYHPLWEPPSEADLKKGQEAVEKAKALGGKTERERDYISAIEAFYKDADRLDHRTRALAYQRVMEKVHLNYPEDREATAFYALALIATASPTDKTYSNQKKAGELLEKMFAEEPDHPGVAHYLIHAYDFPSLADRALTAARRYAKIAPSVPHALHMPSHIFIRLGLWEEAIASSLASAAAAKDQNLIFEQFHALDYGAYAYLQQAQDAEVRRVLEELNTVQEPGENLALAYAAAAIPARYAVETRRWAEAASLEPRSSRYPATEAITYFARAMGSARMGDIVKVREAVEKLQAIHDKLLEARQTYWADQVEVQRRAAAALLAHVEGKNDEALKLMRSAADLEDSLGKPGVTPGPIIPTRELLGDLLLELYEPARSAQAMVCADLPEDSFVEAREPAQALVEFETSLKAFPNRLHGLYGAAKAAELSGDPEKARKFYTKLLEVCRCPDSQRVELQEAKAFLAKE